MSNLKESFDAVRASMATLDGAIAEALNELTAQHEAKLTALEEGYKARLEAQREKYEKEIADYEKALEVEEEAYNDFKEKADRALDLQGDVDAERVGLLPIQSLPLRMLYDKLAERWEGLTASELEMIEEVIDGKVVRL